MKFHRLIPIFFFGACGPLSDSQLKIEMHNDFVPYYDAFIQEGIKEKKDYSSVNITIQYVDTIKNSETENRVLGRCWYDRSLIEINREAWVDLSENKKTSLIFHELGHCILKRQHDNQELFGQKTSIMHWIILSDREFEGRQEYFFQELFTRKKDFDLFNKNINSLNFKQGEVESCQ